MNTYLMKIMLNVFTKIIFIRIQNLTNSLTYQLSLKMMMEKVLLLQLKQKITLYLVFNSTQKKIALNGKYMLIIHYKQYKWSNFMPISLFNKLDIMIKHLKKENSIKQLFIILIQYTALFLLVMIRFTFLKIISNKIANLLKN